MIHFISENLYISVFLSVLEDSDRDFSGLSFCEEIYSQTHLDARFLR